MSASDSEKRLHPRRSNSHERRRSPIHPVPASHKKRLTWRTPSAARTNVETGAGAAGRKEKGDAQRPEGGKVEVEARRPTRRHERSRARRAEEYLARRGHNYIYEEHLHEVLHRRCNKPDAIWSIWLAIIGFACLMIHTRTPRLKSWQDRTVTPAVSVGSILAFGILWLGHMLGWNAHKLLPRGWSLIAFLGFGLGVAGTLDGMEAEEGEPTRTPMLIKVAAFATASLMHWGNFLMSMARQEKPLVQREEVQPLRHRWREGILV